MRRISSILVAIAVLFFASDSEPQISTLKLRQFMTAEEFRLAGLGKLSSAEFDALERWFNRHTLNTYRLAKGGGLSGSSPSGRGYLVENAVNDETFIINGNVYKAKTFCFNLNKGDRVIFADGSPHGACTTAKLVNQRSGNICEVWCE